MYLRLFHLRKMIILDYLYCCDNNSLLTTFFFSLLQDLVNLFFDATELNEQLLKIGTLNVKGFNVLGKQLISFSIFRMKHHLDIIGLTKTKTKKNENKILSKTKNTKKIDKKKQK